MNRWQRIIFATIIVQLTAVLVLFHLLVDSYRAKVARRLAFLRCLMFLSDMGVGFSLFYPGLHRNLPGLGTEIRLTNVPAWTLIRLNLSEPRPTR